jgi:hypothetical protein
MEGVGRPGRPLDARGSGAVLPGPRIGLFVSDSTTASFLEACGSIGPLWLSLRGLRAPRIERRAFAQPFVVIGRAPGADLALDHPAVSRRHVYLQLIDGRLFGVDLSSRTGTYWQDAARPMGWLGAGQSLRVGPCRIGRWGEGPAAAGPGEEPPSPASRAFEPPGLVDGTLEFLDPTVAPASWPIGQVLVLLGRSSACKIQLSGSGVSKIHCSLVRTPAGIWAVDLLGRGGILVDGASTRSARLEDGAVLQVGPHRIRLHYGSPPRPAARAASLPAWPEAAAPPMPRAEAAQILALRDTPPEALLVPLVRELGQMQQQMADQFQQALMMMFQMFSSMHQEQMTLIREQLAELNRLSQEHRVVEAALAAGSAGGRPDREAPRREPPAPNRRDTARPPVGRPPSPERPARPAAPHEDAHAALVDRLSAIQQERESRWQRLVRMVLGGSSP